MYRYQKSHLGEIYLASIVLIALLVLFHQTFLDVWVASHFVLASHQWIYRDNFFLEKIMHKDGVIFVATILVSLFGYWIYLVRSTSNKPRRDYIGFVLISSLLTIVLIFFLKRISTLPCPWNSQVFGGSNNQPSIWEMFSASLPKCHCFPGGHSSGGYAFLSLYFGYTFIYGKRLMRTLIPGLILGLAFGITQQMRGAHFVSHDIATILISIFCSLLTSLIYSNYNRVYEY